MNGGVCKPQDIRHLQPGAKAGLTAQRDVTTENMEMAEAAAAWRADETSLAQFLTARVAGFTGPMRMQKFDTGQSNPTFLLETPGRRYVLRMKPPGQLLKSAHAVEREYKVMQALAGTAVPVPEMLALCEDPGVAGAAFYVMAHVEGRIFWNPALPGLHRAERAQVYDAMNAALASLHSLDPAALGLGDFGRPGNYFARQLNRWSEQYRASQTGELADIDGIMLWLAQNLPPDDGSAAVVHGDWRIDNMIFAADGPKLLAVLDWELSTLGHPLADLAYQCMQWRLPNEGEFRGLGGLDRAALGLPAEAEYVASYCRRRNLPGVDHWKFYLVFSFFRLAAILQGVKKRALDGNASNPARGLKLGEAVPLLGRMAARLAQETAPG